MAKEKYTLTCLPMRLLLLRIPGSVAGRCCKCQGELVIAPSGQKFIEQHPDAEVACLDCVRAEIARDPKHFQRYESAPGAIEEAFGNAIRRAKKATEN